MEHTIKLIELAHDGDAYAREQIVLENMGLVWSVVRRFTGRGVEGEDLFQIGTIGLLKAIDRFSIEYDVKFSTYAVPMIAGEIKRFLRDDGMVKVSRGVKEIAYKAYVVKEQMEIKLKREPHLSEIAEALQIEPQELAAVASAMQEVESLHKVVYQGDNNDITLMDRLVTEEDLCEEVMNHMLLEGMLKCLEEKEKHLIYLRYYEDKTQTQIAQMLGVSQVQVSRMEKKILAKMRAWAG